MVFLGEALEANNENRAAANKGKAEWDPLNRRKESRFPVGISASVCLLKDLEGERSELGHAYVDDLSRNGLKLVTYTPVKKGEEVLVRFASPGSGARTRRVVVCWVDEQSPGRYEVGLGMPGASAPQETDLALSKVYSIQADFVDEESLEEAETQAKSVEVSQNAAQPIVAEDDTPEETEASPPQVTHIIVQDGRSNLEVAALLIVALAFFASMAMLVVLQWVQMS